MKKKKNKWLIIALAFTMVLPMIPMTGVGAQNDVEANYAFIPNSADASVSKVYLGPNGSSIEEVARYSTIEPRSGDDNFPDYRVSRLTIDHEGNAWALNSMTGSSFPGHTSAQGSVARISATPVGEDNTSTNGGDEGIVTNDDRVSYFDLGDPGDAPRTIIAVEENGETYLWIGFYLGGYFQKYHYDGVALVPEGERINVNASPYYAALDDEGIMWISSREASPFPGTTGTAGVFRFDTADPTNTLEQLEYSFNGQNNPYSIIVASDGKVWVSDGGDWNNTRERYFAVYDSDGTPEYVSVGSGSQAMRGFIEYEGAIWATSINGRVLKGTFDGSQWSFASVLTGLGELTGIGPDAFGKLWVVQLSGDSIASFDPNADTIAIGTPVAVGPEPYAYDNFIVPADPPTYEICGYKYLGDTYEGLEGWTINLQVWANDMWVNYTDETGNPVTATTDTNGKYCFTDLPAGTYRVSEVLQPGYTQIFPENNEHIVVLPGGETPENTILYGTQRENAGNNGLYEINLEAGTSTRLFNAGGSGNSPNGLGFDPVNNRLYYMKVSEPNGPSDLFFYDLDTNQELYAGLSLSGQVVVGASFFEGAYYYIPNLSADLHKVTLNPNGTVASDVVLWSNFNGESLAVYRFGDFAINRQGVLYASTNDTGGSTAEFFKLDVKTGEYTLIADKTTPNAALLLQVSFGSDGTLYGHAAGTGEFFTIDLEEGTKTSVGYVSSDLRGSELFSDLASGIQPYDFRNEPVEELTVGKTVETYYEREHEWDINKRVETENEFTIGEEEDAKIWLYVDGRGDETATWYVDVTYESFEDKEFNVSGTITIENTGLWDAVITEVIDELDGEEIDIVWVDEEGDSLDPQPDFPYTLAPGEILTGVYNEDVDGKIEGENVVTITTEQDVYTAEEEIAWGEPDEVRFEEITVKDESDLFEEEVELGTLNVSDSEAVDFGEFSYTEEFKWEDFEPGSYTINNTATIVETEQSASAVLKVNVQDYDDETVFAKGDPAISFIPTFSRWGWTNPIDDGEYTWDLWAGAAQSDTSKGTLVGSVEVHYYEGNVTVEFKLDGDNILLEEHIYAGYDMFPQQQRGREKVDTVAPGQYYITEDLEGKIYVIVHGVVRIPDPDFGPEQD